MKWIVFGHRGWIGSQLVELLELQNETVVKPNIRIDKSYDIEQLLFTERPDRVVMTIGRTHGPGCNTIDYLESKEKLVENIHDNLFAPWLVAHLCQKYKIHCSYLGTGCIFTYEYEKRSFEEDSLPNFFGSQYSTVKGFTDRIMHEYDTLNARIRMPIVGYSHPRNFITKIVSYKNICSIENSMTVLPEMLPIFVDMAKRGITGTVNLVNPGTISHDEILTMYKEIVDPSFTWTNFTQDEQDKVLLSKRSNNALSTQRLEELGYCVTNIKESVRTCINLISKALV